MDTKIVNYSDVFGALPGAAPTTSSFIFHLTPSLHFMHKGNYKMRQETSEFWDMVWLILEIWQ